MKLRIVLVVTLVFLGAACGDAPDPPAGSPSSEAPALESSKALADLEAKLLERRASVEEIAAIFKGADIEQVANRIHLLLPYTGDKRVVELLKKVWRGEKDGTDGFNWTILDTPRVRVALAQLLSQVDGDSRAAYHQYVRDQVKAPDDMTRATAAAALGVAGSNDDIGVLRDLIAQDSELVAFNAAVGLAYLRTDEARRALEALAKDQSFDDRKREHLMNMLSRSKEWSKVSEAGS